MRPLALLPLIALHLLLAACTVAPVEVTISNPLSETRYIAAYDEHDLTVEEPVAGGWEGLAPSVAWLCIEQCGIPGQIVCADVAPPSGAWVIEAGDSVTTTFEGEWWRANSTANGACAERTALTGRARFTACHSAELQGFDDSTVDPPTETGFHDLSPEWVSMTNGACTSVEVDLSQGREVTLELAL